MREIKPGPCVSCGIVTERYRAVTNEMSCGELCDEDRDARVRIIGGTAVEPVHVGQPLDGATAGDEGRRFERHDRRGPGSGALKREPW